jgi:hypothetical protein
MVNFEPCYAFAVHTRHRALKNRKLKVFSCKVQYEFTAASEAYTQAAENEARTSYTQLQVNVHFTRIVPLLVPAHFFGTQLQAKCIAGR